MDGRHPWRGSLAILALAVWWTVALYLLLLVLVAQAPTGEPWSFTPIVT
jgi:hypothetical protein